MTGLAAAVGVTGVAAAKAVGASVAVVENNFRAVGVTVGSAVAAAGWVSCEATWVSTTDVAVIDEAGGEAVSVRLAECAEFESISATVAVTCGVSAGVADGGTGSAVSTGGVVSGGVGTPSAVESPGVAGTTVEGSVWVAAVCAPPLLLTVTPGATSVDDDVAPANDAGMSVVAAVRSSVVVESVVVDVDEGGAETAESVGVLVLSELAAPVAVSVLPPDDDDDEGAVVSAAANPGEVTTAMPIPSAAANAPTRPM